MESGSPRIEIKKESEAEEASKTLIQNLEKSGFAPDFQGEVAEAKKQKLASIAEHLPIIAPQLLNKFQELTKNQNLETGRLGLYVVGGRVYATPIKDTTDFDFVITAENPLAPHIKGARITYHQRHAMGNALYAEVEQIFKDAGIGEMYEKGILEIKGLGERTSEQLEKEEGTLKICELA